MRVQSLVGELKSHLLCGQKNKTQNRDNIVEKFNKDFKKMLRAAKKPVLAIGRSKGSKEALTREARQV